MRPQRHLGCQAGEIREGLGTNFPKFNCFSEEIRDTHCPRRGGEMCERLCIQINMTVGELHSGV